MKKSIISASMAVLMLSGLAACGSKSSDAGTTTATTGEHVHQWSSQLKFTGENDPTCTEDGFMQRECTVCGATELVEVKAFGHLLDENTRACTRSWCDYDEAEYFNQNYYESLVDDDGNGWYQWGFAAGSSVSLRIVINAAGTFYVWANDLNWDAYTPEELSFTLYDSDSKEVELTRPEWSSTDDVAGAFTVGAGTYYLVVKALTDIPETDYVQVFFEDKDHVTKNGVCVNCGVIRGNDDHGIITSEDLDTFGSKAYEDGDVVGYQLTLTDGSYTVVPLNGAEITCKWYTNGYNYFISEETTALIKKYYPENGMSKLAVTFVKGGSIKIVQNETLFRNIQFDRTIMNYGNLYTAVAARDMTAEEVTALRGAEVDVSQGSSDVYDDWLATEIDSYIFDETGDREVTTVTKGQTVSFILGTWETYKETIGGGYVAVHPEE